MNNFENVQFVWTIKNFLQQLGIAPGQVPNGKMAESPVFTSVVGDRSDINKWKAWVEANRIADPNVSFTNGQDLFLTIRVRNQFLKTSSVGIYCKAEILTREKKVVFTILSQTTARGIYSNLTTFQLHRVCNISEIERQNPDLYNNGSLTIVISLGPIQSLEEEMTRDHLVRLQVDSVAKDAALLEPLKMMFDEGVLTDVVVRTKEKDFPCHKVILAASSHMFRAMFESEMKESANNVVDLRNVFDAKTVKHILYFMYTKKCPPFIEDSCLLLLPAADYFQLDLLKRYCVQTLCKIINVDNAAEILQMAEKFNVDILQKLAVKFIVQHSKEVVATPGWKSIPEQMTKYLLSIFLLAVSENK